MDHPPADLGGPGYVVLSSSTPPADSRAQHSSFYKDPRVIQSKLTGSLSRRSRSAAEAGPKSRPGSARPRGTHSFSTILARLEGGARVAIAHAPSGSRAARSHFRLGSRTGHPESWAGPDPEGVRLARGAGLQVSRGAAREGHAPGRGPSYLQGASVRYEASGGTAVLSV